MVVLGDLGRSPRMLYHAASLADAGLDVDLVGEEGAPLPPEIAARDRLTSRRLPAAPEGGSGWLAAALWESLQGLRLIKTLLALPRPDVLLVQTPPAYPTLPLTALVARWRRCHLVFDWHNLGYAILGARLGSGHAVTRAFRHYEGWAGRLARRHLCVSAALAAELRARWGLSDVTVQRDAPFTTFRPLPEAERRARRRRLLADVSSGLTEDRVLLVASPSSWTSDEDFDLVLDAAPLISARVQAASLASAREIVIVATGRGHLRARYERAFEALRTPGFRVRTSWLAPGDYPAMLAASDVGLCLHRSVSGLDLPMKLADFRGVGLPALVLDYGPVLREVFEPGPDGWLFADAESLAGHLFRLASGDPGEPGSARHPLRRRPPRGWSTSWRATSAPVVIGSEP